MKIEEFRSQCEADLSWRLEEIAFIKNQLNYINELKKNKYRKAMVLMLYSHFEGFTKLVFQLYIEYINELNLNLDSVNSCLQASALNKEFQIYDNAGMKNPIFTNKYPNDEKLHRLYRREILVDEFWNINNRKLKLEDSVVNTESNLWYIVLQKNLYRCGLPLDIFEDQKKSIDSLVNRRNSIAHGNNQAGVSEEEYANWEKQTVFVMNRIIQVLYEYIYYKRYKIGMNDTKDNSG